MHWTTLFICVVLAWVDPPAPPSTTASVALNDQFAKEVEDLRIALKIPGLSAAVVKDGRLVWAAGFGLADLENKIPATETTTYRIASLTKTFASTLLLQLVEQGRLSLDDPMSKYSPEFKGDAVKVRHVLSHTSKGTPGERYEYDGNRFASLNAVLEKASARPLRALFVERILDRVGMPSTVPGQDVLKEEHPPADVAARYEAALARLAKPYTLYGDGEQLLSPYPYRPLSASAGLISSVVDLARYDAAIDQHLLLKPESQRLAWTPPRNQRGEALPYGLGWFVQEHHGTKLVWHYGQWPTFSALTLKVPARNVTFIALANSSGMNAPFRLGAGDVLNSPFALAFLRTFARGNGSPLAVPSWSLGAAEFKTQLATLEKGSAGYRYDRETAAHAAIREYIESRRARARKEIAIDSKKLAEYAGSYSLGFLQKVEISVVDGKLIGGLSGQAPMGLFAEAEDRFFAKLADAQATFVRGPDGRVTHLKLRLSGKEYTAAKSK